MSTAPIGAVTPGLAADPTETVLAPGRAQSPAAASEAGQADFASVLGNMIGDLAGTLKTAEAASLGAIKGQVPVQQVVDAVMTAEQTLHGAIAVRDKVVAAYLEISRMQI